MRFFKQAAAHFWNTVDVYLLALVLSLLSFTVGAIYTSNKIDEMLKCEPVINKGEATNQLLCTVLKEEKQWD